MIVAVITLALGLAGVLVSWLVERQEKRLLGNPDRAPRSLLPGMRIVRERRHAYPVCPVCGQRHDPTTGPRASACLAVVWRAYPLCALCGFHHPRGVPHDALIVDDLNDPRTQEERARADRIWRKMARDVGLPAPEPGSWRDDAIGLPPPPVDRLG